jgi:hypothetical protein
LPGIHEALDLIPSTTKKKKRERKEKDHEQILAPFSCTPQLPKLGLEFIKAQNIANKQEIFLCFLGI